jgi:hypothetical protein
LLLVLPPTQAAAITRNHLSKLAAVAEVVVLTPFLILELAAIRPTHQAELR